MTLLGEKICLFLLKSGLFDRFKNPMPTSKMVYDSSKKVMPDYPYNKKLWKDGQRILNLFRPFADIKDKTVLDIGCGNGGKAAFYASYAKKVYGCDIDKEGLRRAKEFSRLKKVKNKTKFIYADSPNLPFKSESFDVIIMNDVMEHFDEPLKTLMEAKRVLKEDGLICISFATWLSPSGSHLNDWIYIPWNNVFFSEKTLIKVLKQLSLSEKYIAFQFPNINNTPLPARLENLGAGNLNKITLREFRRIVKKTGMKVKLFNLGMNSKNPALSFIFKALSKLPLLNEFFGGEMAIVLQK
jgi:ubiquinone/menaquinone biosynthesis C-methylase UbiE